MEKRLILAIALSILVIVIFQSLVKPPAKTATTTSPQKAAASPIAAKEVELKIPLPQEIHPEEKEFGVETEKYILTFSNIGGSIKRIRLKDYKDAHSGEPLDLASINNPKEYIFSLHDPLNSLPLDSAPYELQRSDNAIIYSLNLNELEFTKRYILHNSKHIIELQLIIKNISDGQKALNYQVIGAAGMTEPLAQDRRFIEVTSDIDGKTLSFKRPKAGRIINPGIVTWTASKNKYFSLILRPFIETKSQFYNEDTGGLLVSGVETKEVVMPPKSFVEGKFLLYAGPSRISNLKEYGLEGSLNYGFFGWISKMLLSILGFFYKVVRNWGVSVILISIFLNISLFPLSLKSFKSMQKMQALHPQMEKLKTQYKDNPQKLNKEIMDLYKKNNINPLSGCLPMLLQMPIFIALYNGLIRSIDLKGAHFLWIKDLSLPDAVKIPFSLPILGNSINILPIFMILAMVIQQRISTKTMGGAVTQEQKQQQQMMLIVMPVMFGFIFYNMPSGLVLYWVVNTILTIAEQGIIFKKA